MPAEGQIPGAQTALPSSPAPYLLTTEKERATFLKGYVTALNNYAWMKDGATYVGCGVLTLKDATERANLEYPVEHPTGQTTQEQS